jgi:tRNA U38,U39,U40 pseudouridine synthase TruA
MIRNIVGLLLDINDNKKSLSDIDKIFKSENRCSCGKCASGCGLYLKDIYY